LSRFPAALAACVLLFAPGCSSNLFSDYTEVAAGGMRAFNQGRFDAAAEQFKSIRKADRDHAFLGHAEIGMAKHVGGDPGGAIESWLKADRVRQEFGDRPTISGRTLGEGFVSALVNEKALPYDGEDFEVALLHGMMAWDFLRLGNLDGAMVEVLRGYQVQQQAEGRYGNKYGMNRFSRYIAAVVQEVDANYDEAEIDLKQLAEELPGNAAVEYALGRVQRLQSPEASEERGWAQVVVVHEGGRMPRKIPQEVQYSTKRSLGRISIPSFGPPALPRSGLSVSVGGETVGKTVLIEDVYEVAKANLDDRMGWMLTKGLGRAAAKTILVDQAAKQVERKHGEELGFLVGVVGSFLQFATERADLRSWGTLPQQIEVLRAPIQPGEHSLTVQLPGSGAIDLGIHSFQVGRPVLVTVRSLGGRVYAQVGPLAVQEPLSP